MAHKFQPRAKLEACHANIKDSQFNINWFAGFDVVFNALDNLDARRYVNRMCLAADVPLIESGTTGFNGQVQVIKKVRLVMGIIMRRAGGGRLANCQQSETECYDCNSKEVPKSFPVCTIRSTPSQPIHCIVWAKSYLFPYVLGIYHREAIANGSRELFGQSEDDMAELDTSEDAENGESHPFLVGHYC